ARAPDAGSRTGRTETPRGPGQKALESRIRIRLPPTLVCTISRTVWSANPVADSPVVAGCTWADSQVPTQPPARPVAAPVAACVPVAADAASTGPPPPRTAAPI